MPFTCHPPSTASATGGIDARNMCPLPTGSSYSELMVVECRKSLAAGPRTVPAPVVRIECSCGIVNRFRVGVGTQQPQTATHALLKLRLKAVVDRRLARIAQRDIGGLRSE